VLLARAEQDDQFAGVGEPDLARCGQRPALRADPLGEGAELRDNTAGFGRRAKPGRRRQLDGKLRARALLALARVFGLPFYRAGEQARV
jgi:hypothetical protein